TGGVGILAVVLFFPGGLVEIVTSVRDRLVSRLVARAHATTEEEPVAVLPAPTVLRPRHVAVASVPESGNVIDVCDLTVRFGGPPVVDHVDLRVQAGEIVGLIGSNGAGKSTVMNAIGG